MVFKKGDKPVTKVEDPTPRDIRRACERIQAGWSEREEDKRAGRLRASTWMPPSVDWNSLTEAVNEDQENLSSQICSTGSTYLDEIGSGKFFGVYVF